MRFTALVIFSFITLVSLVQAAPDEDKLGKQRGYPIGTGATWYDDESVRVGSYTHQAEIKGIYRGKPNVLQPSAKPMPLAKAAQEPDIRWNVKDAHGLTVDDYLARQRIMGLLVVKDGVIQIERYQYDRKPTDHFTSNSMAKSIASLAVGIALREGRIKSLDDNAERFAPQLKGSVYGETTIRNLLRMASGQKYGRPTTARAIRHDSATWWRPKASKPRRRWSRSAYASRGPNSITPARKRRCSPLSCAARPA
jgi:CubicO group peptidase (beta-lactamase class C family)